MRRRWRDAALRRLRDAYLTADEEFTRLRLLDTRIAMYQRTERLLAIKALLVTVAACALGAAVVLTVLAGTLLDAMSEHAAVTETLDREAPPPLDPDPELIAHLEGNALALRGYRHEAESWRDAAHKELPADG